MSVNCLDAEDYEYVDFDNPANDCSTAFWTGPYDPRALQYCDRTGTDYRSGNMGDPKQVAADAEVRAAFTVDMDLRTGATELPRFPTVPQRGQRWNSARGQKLRPFRTQKNMYADFCQKHQLEQLRFEMLLEMRLGYERIQKDLANVKEELAGCQKIFKWCAGLEKLVLAEADEGRE